MANVMGAGLARSMTMAAVIACASPALAQVPVADTAREGKETNTATCMVEVNKSKTQSLQPAQGVTGSVAAPGSAGQAATTGSAQVFGGSASVPASGLMLGVDLLGVIANAGVGKNAGGALAQAVAAVAAVAGAMQQNTGGLKTAGGVVGSLSPVQGAWDQNSAARVGSAGLWNQALQGATVTANAQTQRLIQQSATASAASKVMTYDPSSAALVDGNAAPSGSFGLNPK